MMTYAGFFGKMTAFAVKDAYGGLQEMPGVAETFGWFGEVGSMWVLLFAMMTTPILYIVGTLTFQQTVLPRMAPERFGPGRLSAEQKALWGRHLFQNSYTLVGIGCGTLWARTYHRSMAHTLHAHPLQDCIECTLLTVPCALRVVQVSHGGERRRVRPAEHGRLLP
jgi:hypothetical protein